MISSEVQRTLVKSPPELWAELSDPDALARHLGELGEIRIVRTEPESTVEWAAGNTTGTVTIKPSGWGTRVTLSVARETTEAATAIEHEAPVASAPEPAAARKSDASEPEPAGAPEPEASEPATPKPVASEPEPATPEPESASAAICEPDPPSVEPTPRRGLFARLFRRRRPPAPEPADAQPPTPEPPAPEPGAAEPSTPEPAEPKADAFAAIREALAPETFAAEHAFAALPPVDIAAELQAAEEAGTETGTSAKAAGADDEAENEMTPMQDQQAGDAEAELAASEEEVTAVLTAVLDRLGAAHHRPFSRS